jgi:hypothetical protein
VRTLRSRVTYYISKHVRLATFNCVDIPDSGNNRQTSHVAIACSHFPTLSFVSLCMPLDCDVAHALMLNATQTAASAAGMYACMVPTCNRPETRLGSRSPQSDESLTGICHRETNLAATPRAWPPTFPS